MKTVLVSWSSGKDSVWMLASLLADARYTISGLFTTINEPADRIAMHAVPVPLLKKQAEAIGQHLRLIPLPDPCRNEDYERIMTKFINQCREEGVACVAFGDLFLKDIRLYREKQMQDTGIDPIFPIWLEDTRELAQKIIGQGYKAIITSIDLRKLGQDFIGRIYDEQFIANLPPDIDPCGENGEFHTFVYDGPILKSPVRFEKGAVFERNGFLYQDIIPSDA